MNPPIRKRMNSKTKAWLIAAGVLLLFLAGFLSGVFAHRAWSTPWVEQTDTTTVIRTAQLDSLPQTVTTAPAPESVPPVTVPASSVERDPADTSVVRIRPELTTITGTLTGGLSYQAVLGGVQPSLQQLTVTYPETVVTNNVYKPYKGWLLSATADIAAFATPQLTVVSRVAIETSYNTGPLHLGLQGGVIMQPAPGSWNISPYIGARITLDICRLK